MQRFGIFSIVFSHSRCPLGVGPILKRSLGCLAWLSLACSVPALAQTAAGGLTPVRDADAVATVQNAIAALGGASAISLTQDCVIQAQVNAPTNGFLQAGSLVWKASGGEFRWDFLTPSGPATLGSGHGNAFKASNAVVGSAGNHIALVLFVPALVGANLLREVNNPNHSFMSFGSGTVADHAVKIVHSFDIWNNVVTPQTWYFDASTGLPLRVEYRHPDLTEPKRGIPAIFDFSNYTSIAGVLYPLQIIWTIGPNQVGTIAVSSIQTNVGLAASAFDAPTGGAQ